MITTSLPHLDEALRPLDRELGDVAVLVGGTVERGGDDFGAQHVATHVGDLFGPLVDEQHHDVHSGLLRSIEYTICLMIVVLPALGGDTIMPR